MTINAINLLKGEYPRLRVKITERLRKKLLNKNEYSFKFNSFNLKGLLYLGQKTKINKNEILSNIVDIKTRNRAAWSNFPMKIPIDEEFVAGIGYYIGDGRLKTSRGLSAVSIDLDTIKFFLNWLTKYFNADTKNIKINISLPRSDFNLGLEKRKWSKLLGVNINSVKRKCKYKDYHKTLVEVCYFRTISKLTLDKLIPLIKEKCSTNKHFAAAYLRGIMAAEGSPRYNEKSHQRAIHLKMKDKTEVEYICKLLQFLDFTPDLFFSKQDKGWIASITGFYELKRSEEMNIFKLNGKRKERLKGMLSNYHHQQVKKGKVKEFYLTKLFEFEKRHGKYSTAKQLSKYLKRDKTRVVTVLRKLQKNKLLSGERIIKTGRPVRFTLTEKGREFILK